MGIARTDNRPKVVRCRLSRFKVHQLDYSGWHPHPGNFDFFVFSGQQLLRKCRPPDAETLHHFIRHSLAVKCDGRIDVGNGDRSMVKPLNRKIIS